MNESEAIELFERHGAKVVNGQILAGSSRHGRIGYSDIRLEDGRSLPLDSLDGLASTFAGESSVVLEAHLKDGSVLE